MTRLSRAQARVWSEFLESLPSDDPRRDSTPDAFAFGGTDSAVADELASLTLRGVKRATTSLAVEFTSENEPLPRVGSLSIILDGRGTPVAIIERSAVTALPFGDVDAAYAAIEGEADGSLAHWRRVHADYFSEVCRRLGGTFDESTTVLCQQFRLVWPTLTEVSPRPGAR